MVEQVAEHRFKLYPTRWYILLAYSAIVFMQGYIWNQWGPIYASMHSVFGWTSREAAILAFYGTLFYSICVVPASIAGERFGFRTIVVGSAFLVFASCVVRCFSFIQSNKIQTILVHISAILNGIPGCTTWYGPPTISARWFGPHERKLATALGTMINSAGVAVSFILGPSVVQQPGPHVTPESMRNRYFYLTWAQTVVTLHIFIMTLVYYPNEPKTPPSHSAEVKRVDYLPAIKTLMKSKSFWQVFFPFLLLAGAYFGWSPCFPFIIKAAKIDEGQAGWIAFWGNVAGVTISICVGKLADVFGGHLKAFLVAFSLLVIEGVGWLVMITNGYIPFTDTSVWISTILINVAVACYLPLILETAAELCYPVDESVVIAVLGVLVQIENCIVLIVLFFPSISLVWANWFLLASTLVAFPFVLWLPSKFKRSIDDENPAEAPLIDPNQQIDDSNYDSDSIGQPSDNPDSNNTSPVIRPRDSSSSFNRKPEVVNDVVY